MSDKASSDSSKNRIKTYVLISLFTAIIAVCSFITVPAPVPFTLQTFGIFVSLTVLGGKRGTVCTVIYILLGVLGIPVFSGFSAGLGHLSGATGGYSRRELNTARFWKANFRTNFVKILEIRQYSFGFFLVIAKIFVLQNCKHLKF